MAATIPGVTVPTGAEFYQQQVAEAAASQAAQQLAAAPQGSPEYSAASPGQDPLSAYRQVPGAAFELYKGGKVEATLTPEELAARRGDPALSDLVVSAFDPVSGERRGVRLGDLDQALVAGFRLETVRDAAVREQVEKHRGLSGTAIAAVTSAADEALLGVPDIASRNLDPEGYAKVEAIRKDHQLASLLGRVGGFGLSVFAGGPVAKGAQLAGKGAASIAERALVRATEAKLEAAGVEGAASVARGIAQRVLPTAAKFAAEAGTYAAPGAVTEAALGDPEHAAESLLLALGAGAVLGGAGAAAGDLLKRLPAKRALELTGLADKFDPAEQAWSALSPTQNMTRQAQRELGAKEGTKVVGQALLDMGLAPKVNEASADFAERVMQKQEEVGKRIGGLIDGLDEAAAARGARLPPSTKGSIVEEVGRDVLVPLSQKVSGEGAEKAVARHLESFVQRAPDELALRDIHAARSSLKELTDLAAKQGLSTEEAAFRRLYGIYTRHLEREGQRLAEAVDRPGWLAELRQANDEFRMLSLAAPAAERGAAQEATNATFGLLDTIRGSGAAKAAGIAGALVGGLPAAAAAGIAGAGLDAASTLASKWLRKNWAALVTNHGDKAGILAAEQGLRMLAEGLDAVPQALSNQSTLRRAGVATAPGHAIARLFDLDPKEKASDLFAEASGRLATLTDVDRTAQALGQVTAPLREGGAPTVASALMAKKLNALSYLHETMPRDPRPFDPLDPQRSWSPGRAELDAWERRVEVVADPFAVVRHLQAGTLSREHVEALSRVWPTVHESIAARALEWLSSTSAQRMPPARRAQLRVLLGKPAYDPRSTALLQSLYVQAEDKEIKRAGGATKLPGAQPTTVTRLAG